MKFHEHPSYIGLANDFLEDERMSKWEKQYNERGFDDTSLWSLDFSICAFIYTRLKELARIRNEVFDLTSEDDKGYHKDIEIMLIGFDPGLDCYCNPENNKKRAAAFEALSRQYDRLWW